ncbi:tyrosinase family oxidase copper chaperone [Streptomyces sp. NPDC002125]
MNPTTGASGEPSRTTGPARRAVLRTAFTATVVACTGGVLAPVLLRKPEGVSPGPDRDAVGPERFSEVYKGRDIRGTATADPADAHPFAGAQPYAGAQPLTGAQPYAGGAGAAPDAEIHIDGRALHVMRRADGTYLSTVNHYESFPTLRETARAAVDELGTAQLSAVSPHTI